MSDLSPEARALLEVARHGDDPSPQDHDRVARSLAASLGIAVLAPATAQATSVAVASATTLTAFKTVAVVAALVAVGAGSVWSRRPTVAVRSMPASESRPMPTRRAADAPLVPAVAREPSPPPVAVVEAPPVPPRSPPHTAHTAAPTVDTLRAESELLGEAHRAMNSGALDQALAILTTYRERFPHGVLREERDVQRVLVLCRLGRHAEARAAAAGFLRAHPHSPLVPRVERACAPPPVP